MTKTIQKVLTAGIGGAGVLLAPEVINKFDPNTVQEGLSLLTQIIIGIATLWNLIKGLFTKNQKQ